MASCDLKLFKGALTLAAVLAITTLASAAPASAQSISTLARERSQWFNSPREFQIIDDAPVVRNFQEAPVPEQTIDLAFGGGCGAGALGGQRVVSISGNGMPLSSTGNGYRTPARGNLAEPPRSGFGREMNAGSNAARRIGPLPYGCDTNRLMSAPTQCWTDPLVAHVVAPRPRPMTANMAYVQRSVAAPSPLQYDDGAGYGSNERISDAGLRGRLLRH